MAGDNTDNDTTSTGTGATGDEAAQQQAERPDTSSENAESTGRESATDTDWKAEAEKWKRLSRQNEKSFKDSAEKLRQYEDANKTEAERLQEERDTARSRAEKAESALRRREIAEQAAPEHATTKQIAQVAKRLTGDDDEALEADAVELFELIAPEPKSAPKTPARPQERLQQERLRGGSEPDEEPGETDPRKLAALIPRRR